jgi:5-formyltetrahydrofolate cyclo-ligase
MLDKRRSLSPETRLAKSLSLSKTVKHSRQFQAAHYIHLYLANKTEVETKYLIREAFLLKKKVAVPIINTQRRLSFSELSSLDEDNLESGSYGIRQPLPAIQKQINAEQIDLWIIPGVAFDIMGGRLGYGGGYYDRALAQTHSCIMGLAFDLQVLTNRLPLVENDVPVDEIFTETRRIHCKENRRVSEYH